MHPAAHGRASCAWLGCWSKAHFGFQLQHITIAVYLRLTDCPPRQGVSWLWPITARSSSDFPIQYGLVEPWECQFPWRWVKCHMLRAHVKTVQTSEHQPPPSQNPECALWFTGMCRSMIQAQAWVTRKTWALPLHPQRVYSLPTVMQLEDKSSSSVERTWESAHHSH